MNSARLFTNKSHQHEVPFSPSKLLNLSANEAIQAVHSGRLSCETYVRALIQQAQKHSSLNSLILLNDKGSIQSAQKIDRDRAAGNPLPSLAGLVIVVKDNINTCDFPTTAGTPALKNSRPKFDAPCVKKLTDAGAIILGKTNLHELSFGITSTNTTSFAGPVKNPYDTTRIPGGSSGGTAASIASRIVACGLGTDTGGSTRIPAALCGIVGLRPSVGNGGGDRRYHNENAVVPLSRTRDTVGPMGRTVGDVALLDAAITGTPIALATNISGVRIGVPSSFWADLDATVIPVLRSALQKLAAAGVILVDVDLPVFALNEKVSFPVLFRELLDDMPAYLAAIGSAVKLEDICTLSSSPDVHQIMKIVLQNHYSQSYDEAMRVNRPLLQQQYAHYFKANAVDAVLVPTTVLPAVNIDLEYGSGHTRVNKGPLVDTLTAFIRNTDPASNAGIPSLSLPAGLTRQGLPVGLLLDGPLGSDRQMLSLGLSFEKVLGVLPPPNFV